MTFIAPFHWKLWLGVVSLSIGSSMFLWLFQLQSNGFIISKFFEAFTTSLSSMFGFQIGVNVIDGNASDIKTSTRIVLFTIKISGSLLFYFYGGFLTSALVIPSEAKPFTTPDGILKTNYRYILKDHICIKFSLS